MTAESNGTAGRTPPITHIVHHGDTDMRHRFATAFAALVLAPAVQALPPWTTEELNTIFGDQYASTVCAVEGNDLIFVTVIVEETFSECHDAVVDLLNSSSNQGLSFQVSTCRKGAIAADFCGGPFAVRIGPDEGDNGIVTIGEILGAHEELRQNHGIDEYEQAARALFNR